MKCDECGASFLNYDSWYDESSIHPDTGTVALVLACPDCGEELSREYDQQDPRHAQ